MRFADVVVVLAGAAFRCVEAEFGRAGCFAIDGTGSSLAVTRAGGAFEGALRMLWLLSTGDLPFDGGLGNCAIPNFS